MASTSIDSSSRFEEIVDEPPPAAVSEPTFPQPTTTKQEPQTHTQAAAEEHTAEDGDSESGEHDDSVWWTPSELRDIIDRSTELKAEGNRLFGRGEWENALVTYREGLVELPVRTKPSAALSLKGKEKQTEEEGEGEEEEEKEGEVKDEVDGTADLLTGLKVEAEKDASVAKVEGAVDEDEEMAEVVELRSILFANVAACHIKLERWKEAVQACDDALEDNASYTKALQRRALANESLGSWSSLASALEDYNALAAQPLPAPLSATVKAAQRRLPGLIAAQQEKEKDEVLGKLKDLGNTVLGKFGFSTDNFKFTEQPGGGYSMNFQR